MLVYIRSSPFLLIFVTPSFPRADAISSSVANVSSILLMTCWVSYAGKPCISSYERFLFLMFSVALRLSTSASKLPFLVFLTVFGLALVETIFSMKKGENLTRQTSSKDSTTMNLRKSAVSFFGSDSEKFCLVFYLKMPYMQYIFRWSFAP